MLKELCSLCGASGYETPVIKYICGFLKENEIPYEVDKLGNIMAFSGENPQNFGIFAHMDEVGFGVRGITSDGMIKFAPIGGILEKILPSSCVQIGENKVNGVIGNKPKHLKQNKEAALTYDDLFIDIGAKNKEDALKYVNIGDPIYWISEYREFGDGLIKSKALDDRAGVYAILMLLKEKKYSFTAVFNTREEIGLFGAKTITPRLNIKNALVLETTTCADMIEDGIKTTVLGNGPALSVMDGASVSNAELNKMIWETAQKNKIPIQKKLTVKGGNDAGSISYRSGGIKTAVLSLPGRYIHSPVTVISKNDLNSMINICKKILEDYKPE